MPNTAKTERRYLAISPQSFTADGTTLGVVTIASLKIDQSRMFKVKQVVTLMGTGLTNIDLEVKKVLSDTQLVVGPLNTRIDSVYDVSAFTVAVGATIEAREQKRPIIPEQEITTIIYDEEPTLAHRNVLVDWLGNYYSSNNPLPVQLSDGSIDIGTVNAELEVQLSHKDNYPDAGDVADSVRIGDGTDVLEINNDGSINIVTLSLDGPATQDKITVSNSVLTELKVNASALTDRKVITVQPLGGKLKIYFGDGISAPSIATVDSDGFIHFKWQMHDYEAAASQPIYLLSDSGTIEVIISERA